MLGRRAGGEQWPQLGRISNARVLVNGQPFVGD